MHSFSLQRMQLRIQAIFFFILVALAAATTSRGESARQNSTQCSEQSEGLELRHFKANVQRKFPEEKHTATRTKKPPYLFHL